MKVYALLGKDYPSFLDVPIVTESVGSYLLEEESDFVSPKLDGKVTNFFEWLGAGVLTLKKVMAVLCRGRIFLLKNSSLGGIKRISI